MKPTLIAAPVAWALDAEPVGVLAGVPAGVVLVDALFLLLDPHAAKRAAIVTAHTTDKTLRRVAVN